MLHPQLLGELLAAEVEVARERLGGRCDSLLVHGPMVVCAVTTNGHAHTLALDATRYDAEPLALSVTDASGATVPAADWPPGLYYSEHPVLHRPWSCTRGTFEYHLYPGHHTEPWDAIRREIRLADLLDHLLRKCGR